MLDAVARQRIQYRCAHCGRVEPKWLGVCPGCGNWNTLEQESAVRGSAERPGSASRPIPASRIQPSDNDRTPVGIAELDRVLGGGLVCGSAVLLGGEPGIGKSTLLIQVCDGAQRAGLDCLYVSGEESPSQVRQRADRLGAALDRLHLLAETDCEQVIGAVREGRFGLLVIDSIQTLRCPDLPSAPGSVAQVRESASRLSDLARQAKLALVLIGHVTKEGTLAGPRTLEHLVDTVLYFEADAGRGLRVVRAHKNRHGAASEIGVFEMTGRGLVELPNPSAAFLADRPSAAAGSAVFAALRGSRPILVEVQALVSPSPAALPRRTALGCDPMRVALLAAVLERRLGLPLAGCDLFLNVAGGLRLDEPAADLAICLAILSSQRDRPVRPQAAVFGEVGLSGEIRSVPAAAARAAESLRMGFDYLLLPEGNLEQVPAGGGPLRPVGLSSVGQLDETGLLAEGLAAAEHPARPGAAS
ncbi:MAG: DNA repair protein RadA [Deltaproteobacteria bacterium]|nr:DNA repair protein RadA [Deltaproteobacteria bacterium]